jgi:hypothetical protein
MPRQNVRELYEKIHPYVEQYAREYYRGLEERGFRHWAFHEKFLEYDLSDTDIRDSTAIDGPDDFEVDGYHVVDAEEAKVIHLFQSKFRSPGTNMGSSELSQFLEAPVKLFNAEMVASCHNQETKTLHDILVRLVPLGYSLHLTWVTGGTLSHQARQYADGNSTRTIPAPIGGKIYDVLVTLDASDLRDLVTLFQSHLESDETSLCNITFDVEPQRCHEVPGDYKTLVLTLRAGQIIDAFNEHRFKIFRLNPRGPLGNKTNVRIKETLLDPVRRHMFHILNNGLSAICDSYRLSGAKLAVRDFQIVNGCQTTVTLWSVRSVVQSDPEVLVNLKLIECQQHFHRLIAETTNTQAPLRAEDFISTDVIQIDLQRQFGALSPPWFYQVKRSEWSRMIGGARQKERYIRDDGSYRWLKSKDVAQALVAFLGFPGEAKDKIRFFFEGNLSSELGEISYKNIYAEGVSAIQLLLPSLVYQKITAQIDHDTVNGGLGVGFDWLDYARLHLLWLIGELLRGTYQIHRTVPFPKARAQSLIESVEDWSIPLYQVARAAITNAVDQARQDSTYRGPREFFRSPANYRSMSEKLPLAMGFARQFADPLAKLPPP